MRKITTNATEAFISGENFKSGNTEVITDSFNSSRLYLHGNVIAILHRGPDFEELCIDLCGWNTPTTRDRLNGIPGVSINTKNGTCFLNGEPISTYGYVKVR